jgi:hypothetical protein
MFVCAPVHRPPDMNAEIETTERCTDRCDGLLRIVSTRCLANPDFARRTRPQSQNNSCEIEVVPFSGATGEVISLRRRTRIGLASNS